MNEQMKYHFVVSALGGPSLQELRERLPQHRYTLRSALFLSERVLNSIYELHRAGYLHRDVKPEKFVIGRDKDTRGVYMIGTSLARRWVIKETKKVVHDSPDDEIRPPRMQAGFRGSLRYASLAAHLEHDLGRAQDLWSWFFVTVDFTVNSLPWDVALRREGISEAEMLQEVKTIKEATVDQSEKILEGCPHEYKQIYDHLKTLKYYDTPCYSTLFNAIRAINARKNYNDATPVDWEPRAERLQVVRAEKTVMGSVKQKLNPVTRK